MRLLYAITWILWIPFAVVITLFACIITLIFGSIIWLFLGIEFYETLDIVMGMASAICTWPNDAFNIK